MNQEGMLAPWFQQENIFFSLSLFLGVAMIYSIEPRKSKVFLFKVYLTSWHFLLLMGQNLLPFCKIVDALFISWTIWNLKHATLSIQWSKCGTFSMHFKALIAMQRTAGNSVAAILSAEIVVQLWWNETVSFTVTHLKEKENSPEFIGTTAHKCYSYFGHII